MQIISSLSLQFPSMSFSEFKILSKLVAQGVPTRELHEYLCSKSRLKAFLEEKGALAFVKASDDLKKLIDLEIEVLFPGHSKYSSGYFELEDPPLHLTLEGSLNQLTSVAIVGSREPSRYAIDWLNEHLPRALSRRSFSILSGGARGVDMTSHLIAAKVGLPTIVFVPAGLRALYPRDLEKWKRIILESGGGFISEFPLHRPMHRYHFIKRNRLIVAASDLVFVAEARRKSGSMLTANIARGMSRTLCTLPTSPSMSCGQGSLDLIFDGAFPLRDHLDLVALIEVSSKRV